MPSQSKKQQQGIIAAATKDGSLDTLYWFIEADTPLRAGMLGRPVAVKVNGKVPVIPVVPCAQDSEADADLLRWLCEQNQRGNGYRFSIALTAADILESYNWAVWGEENVIDNICPECGQVHQTNYEELWHCCGWSQALKRSQLIAATDDDPAR